MNRITDNLYLGSRADAALVIKQFGGEDSITHVLSLSKAAGHVNPSISPIKLLTLPMSDYGTTQIFEEYVTRDDAVPLSIFDRACAFIKSASGEGGRVLVHCEKGQNRSATILIAYLMRQYDLGFQDAFSKVQTQRPIVCPHGYYVRQLKDFEVRECRDIVALVKNLLPEDKDSLDLIRKILTNIADNPEEQKFRRLASSDRVRSLIFGKLAAVNILHAAGWQWDDSSRLVLPIEVSVDAVRATLEETELAVEKVKDASRTDRLQGVAQATRSPIEEVKETAKSLLEAPGGMDSLMVVQKVLQNVLEHPDDTRYAKLDLAKDRVRKTIAERVHAQDLLRAAGWYEFDDWHIAISPEASRDRTQEILDCMKEAVSEHALLNLDSQDKK